MTRNNQTFQFTPDLDQTEARRLFVKCDQDGDRKLTLEELKAMLQH